MSQGALPPAADEKPRATGRIRNPQDFYGGLVLIAIAIFATWASSDLPGMRGFAFGPGTAPRMFATVLGAFGAAITLIGLFTAGPALERYAFRGPFWITISTLVFAALIRPAGLIIASFVSIMLSAAGSTEVRWLETILVAIGLTIFCTLLFPYALNLPFQLGPRF
jgi:putative tricarboxylic transport membrane protein